MGGLGLEGPAREDCRGTMKLTSLEREVKRAARQPEDARRQDMIRWVVLLVVYVLTVAVTSPFYLFSPIAPPEGTRLDGFIRAETDFRFVLQSSVDQFEKERRQFHKRVYDYDPEVKDQVLQGLDRLYAATDALDPGMPPAELLASMRRADSRFSFLTESRVGPFLTLFQDHRFRQALRGVVRTAYEDHVVVERMINFKGYMKDRVVAIAEGSQWLESRREVLDRPLPFPVENFEWNPIIQRQLGAYSEGMAGQDAWEAMQNLLRILVRPDLVYDEARTRAAYENFPARDLSTQFTKDQVLVDAATARRGITAEQARLLEEHRNAILRQHQVRLAGHGLYVLIVMVILSFFLKKFSREFEFTAYNVLLFSLPILLALVVQAFFILLAEGEADIVGYLFPAGAIGMLGVLLLDVRMALLLVTWGCLLFALQTDLKYDFVIVGLFGGYTGVAMLYTIRKRWEVFLASVVVGIVNGAVIMITGYIRNPDLLPFASAGIGLIAGIASFLILAILPIFERFGLVTDMQLLELTGLHHPLLREIEEVAPGTWQHTLNVTKLAEAAASLIGVNYLLVRAGCYYHDVGKVKKPEYFTENQITNEDKMRHAELKPQMSTLIIKNHVKEGVEMARAEGLPERIIDFIRQHHGTSTITYFFNKAREAEQRGEMKEPVREEDYRYPGPKPQTIETAIVMLADTVEATATARLSGRTVREDDIQQIVRSTVFEKFNDGQFDECNLTMRDLNVIRETFVKVLKARFHTRIDYPKRSGSSRPSREKRDREYETSSALPLDSRSSTSTDINLGAVRK